MSHFKSNHLALYVGQKEIHYIKLGPNAKFE